MMTDSKPADPAEVAELCTAAGRPRMAAALIRNRRSLAEVHERIRTAADVERLFAAASAANSAIDRTLGTALANDAISADGAVAVLRAIDHVTRRAPDDDDTPSTADSTRH